MKTTLYRIYETSGVCSPTYTSDEKTAIAAAITGSYVSVSEVEFKDITCEYTITTEEVTSDG